MTSRAIAPVTLFEDDLDYTAFVHGLERAIREDGLQVQAYCLLGNQFHLLVRSGADVLSTSMRRLKGWYAHLLNDRRERYGPIFDARYGAAAIRSERHAYAALVYIAVKPVRAGLVSHPDDWPWASHRAHAELVPRPDWLLPLGELGIDPHSYRCAVSWQVADGNRLPANAGQASGLTRHYARPALCSCA